MRKKTTPVSRFIPNIGYTRPVTKPEHLENSFPIEIPKAEWNTKHQLVVKTFNSPETARLSMIKALNSSRGSNGGVFLGRIADDSNSKENRTATALVATELGTEYFCSKGENSLASAFVDFVTEHASCEEVVKYCKSLLIEYGSKDYGGVAGIQNLSHLAAIMSTANLGKGIEKLFCTFIDDDVEISGKDAMSKINLLREYYLLGETLGTRISLIGGGYNGDSGSASKICELAFRDLLKTVESDDLDSSDIQSALENIFARKTNLGKKTKRSANKYFISGRYGFGFPGGNYTINGGDIISTIPIPTILPEDVLFSLSITGLAKPLENVYTARGPNFQHNRSNRQTAEGAYGNMLDCFGRSDILMQSFRKAIYDLSSKEGKRLLEDRETGDFQNSVRGVRSAALLCHKLENILTARGDISIETLQKLRTIKLALVQNGKAKFDNEIDVEAYNYAINFLQMGMNHQPEIAKLAYDFGKNGLYREYQDKVKC